MPTTRRGWIGIAVVVIAVVLTGGAAVVLFSLMVDETHFARPDAGFDELGERVAAVDADGVERVQITAPKRYQAAIEAAIASSRLPIADLPVRFLSE